MRGISILGVLVGGVFDIIASSIGGAVLIAIILAVTYTASGSHPDAKQLAHIIGNSASLETALAAYGALVSVAAGYLAARIANRAELLNGTLSSFLCVAQGVVSLSQGPAHHSIVSVMFDIALSPLCALAGGYLRALRKQAASRATAA